MSGHRGTETEFELATIERLEQLGYQHTHGSELQRDHAEVVLRDTLRANLAHPSPDLPPGALDSAVALFSRPEGVDTLGRNFDFHQKLVRGVELKVELPDGRSEHRHLSAIDFDRPEANDFAV